MIQPQHVIEISDDDDDDAPEIEESEWKKKLFASLNAIQAEPRLVSFRSYHEFVNPGLKIGGQQIIPLPLTDHYADIIKELSHSVQGTDNKAQNVWELDRAQFDLINPAWRSCLDRIAQDITKELDIQNALLSPKKLTLQGPGPIVEQDQSLEQSDRIVGHISICLPSEHHGGDIGVSLGGRRKTVSTAASSALALSAIGWISSAHSLATELVSGYRLTISYIVHRFNDGKRNAPSSYVGSGRLEEVLQMWQRRHFGTKKILYKLDDKKGTGVLSLREARGRDKAVCEALSAACSEAGLYMLFAEITHEVTDNLIQKTVESSINGLFTPEGQFLAENKELDAENEVLGFDVDRQWDLEPASDDDEGMSNEHLIEEHEMTRRWHDYAVLLIPKEGLLNMVRPDDSRNTSPRPGRHTRDHKTHHPGVAPVVAMVVDDLEKNPAGTIKVAENIIDKLCDSGTDTQVLCTCVNPIVNWCLRSGYMPLYTTAFRKTPITVVHVLAEYLAGKYEGSEDSIDWKEWLDGITKKPIVELGLLYRDFSRTILAVSTSVWKSFDGWSETIMDEKLNTELNWEYKDLEMILDLMRLRCDSTQWIVNRLEPAEEGWLVETPRHDLICGPFIRLITECHAIGAFVEASRVVEETFSLFVAEKARWILVKDPFGVIFCLITPLIRLSADGLWRKIPALLDTLELLVRKIIRLDLPRQSQGGGGLVFRERGCGFCGDCAALDRFLTSPEKTVWEFNAPKARRLHIEHAIGVENSLQALRILNQTTGTCEKLAVTKTGAQAEPDLRSWVFNYNGLERVLQPLRGDFMKKALGEKRYCEIILLTGCDGHFQRVSSDHRNRMGVDTSVRNTWELDASKFNLVNKKWFEDFSTRILRDTTKGLCIFELRANPHKLLPHEPGSFFQTHSDSEKEQDMIGTLVHSRALKSMLDHLYTKPSLCLRDLKSHDRSVGRCLNEICSEAGFYFMLGQTTRSQVDCDGCQDQTTLRILYNLNGDQLSPKLVLDFEDFLDYDIGRKSAHSEDDGDLFDFMEARPLLFHSQDLRKHRDEEEWILRTFVRRIVPRAERSLLKSLSWCMPSQRNVLYDKLPELYKSILDHGGQQLCFTVEEVRSRLSKDWWLQGWKLIEQLKEAYINSVAHEALRLLEQSCKTLNDNKEIWLPEDNYGMFDQFLDTLLKILEANKAPPIPAVQDFLETALLEGLHRSIHSRSDELVGWAHKSPPVGTKQSAKTSNGLMLSLRILNSKYGNTQSIARN
ncbi:hypothetical protein F25303_7645 [Fusarium sp. NRRL 25303]|nr:hypothetical protein F25303_7645 [Fusarium sp. NRRL 25303]